MERSFPYFRGESILFGGRVSLQKFLGRNGVGGSKKVAGEERRGLFRPRVFFRKKEGRGTNSSFPQEAWRKPAAGKNVESSSLPSLVSLLKARQTLPSSPPPPPPPPRLLLKLRLRGRDEERGSEDARGGIEVERR